MAYDLASMLMPGKDPSHVTGLNDILSGRLGMLMQAAPENIRTGLSINSGFRSPEHQARLYQDALAKYGSPEAARKWVAPPGKSQHNHGNAADLHYASPEVKDWVHQNAGQYGLHFRMGHEPWHIEPMTDWQGTPVTPPPMPQPSPPPPQSGTTPPPLPPFIAPLVERMGGREQASDKLRDFSQFMFMLGQR